MAKVTAGYGPGGGYPIKFSLPPGESSDTCFLKLFVTTEPVDLNGIVQKPPWNEDSTTRRGCMVLESIIWDAWVAAITVVERKTA